MGCDTALIPHHIRRISIALLRVLGTSHGNRRQRIGNQLEATMLFASIDFVNSHYFQLSKRHWLDDEDQMLSSLTRLHANGTSFNSSVGRVKRESRT